MRLRTSLPVAALTLVATLAHADTLSIYNIKDRTGAANLGTFTVDTTTGVVEATTVILGPGNTVSGPPLSQGFDPYLNEYVSVFTQGVNSLIVQLPELSLVGYAPANSTRCATQAVFCDYLIDAYTGPISSKNLAAVLEGDLVLASTTTAGTTPEPSSVALLGTGLLGLAGLVRRHRPA